jgi:hypothetical protein
MNKPAFVFDGRLLVDAKELTKIGFKVSSIIYILVCEQCLTQDLGHYHWSPFSFALLDVQILMCHLFSMDADGY